MVQRHAGTTGQRSPRRSFLRAETHAGPHSDLHQSAAARRTGCRTPALASRRAFRRETAMVSQCAKGRPPAQNGIHNRAPQRPAGAQSSGCRRRRISRTLTGHHDRAGQSANSSKVLAGCGAAEETNPDGPAHESALTRHREAQAPYPSSSVGSKRSPTRARRSKRNSAPPGIVRCPPEPRWVPGIEEDNAGAGRQRSGMVWAWTRNPVPHEHWPRHRRSQVPTRCVARTRFCWPAAATCSCISNLLRLSRE